MGHGLMEMSEATGISAASEALLSSVYVYAGCSLPWLHHPALDPLCIPW